MGKVTREPDGRPDTARPASVGAGRYVVARVSAASLEITMTPDPDPLLTSAEVGELLDMSASAWRSRVSEGYAPKADDPGDLSVSPRRRNPRWRRSTVARYQVTARPRRKRKPKPEEGAGDE